jgi:hypothetical protein
VADADDPGRGRHVAPPVPQSPGTPPTAADPVPVVDPLGAPTAPSAPGPDTAPGRHRAGSLTRISRIGRWSLLTLAVVTAAVALVLALTTSKPADDDTDPGTTAAGRDLGAWAGAQLPPGATLQAEPALAADLARSGVQAGMLTTGASAGADAPALQVLRSTEAGDRAVIARFTDATGQLLVVDPAAVPPDAAQLDRRRQLGAALLANPMTAVPEAAAQRLRDGEVDPRLLTLLAGMAARFGIQLSDLPPVAGEEAGAPARAALVGAVEGKPLVGETAELTELRTYLAAQLDTFSPDEVQLTDGGLLVRFRYTTDPDGAVTRGGE